MRFPEEEGFPSYLAVKSNCPRRPLLLSLRKRPRKAAEMHDRAALEEPHTLEEMRGIIVSFIADREAFPDSFVHRRRGLAKDMIEEYAPLSRLACEVKGFKSARLTRASLPGPDAIIELSDGVEISVQITTSGETESTALQRELLSQGKPIFPTQHASRSPGSSKRVSVTGRVLTTKQAETDRMIHEVKRALRKKIRAYRAGTQCLLILIQQKSLTMMPNWASQLAAALVNESVAPYSAVYVVNADSCTRCAGA